METEPPWCTSMQSADTTIGTFAGGKPGLLWWLGTSERAQTTWTNTSGGPGHARPDDPMIDQKIIAAIQAKQVEQMKEALAQVLAQVLDLITLAQQLQRDIQQVEREHAQPCPTASAASNDKSAEHSGPATPQNCQPVPSWLGATLKFDSSSSGIDRTHAEQLSHGAAKSENKDHGANGHGA
jgi:hypothetical protein